MNSIELNEQVIRLIPEDILADVPEEKKEEFKKGIMLYLSRERQALYKAAQETPLSGETEHKIVRAIRDFQKIVKNRHGGKNA